MSLKTVLAMRGALRRVRFGMVALAATAICAATASAATLTHRWSFNGTTDAENLTDAIDSSITATKNTDRITWDGTNMVMRGNGEGKLKTGLFLGTSLLDTSAATIEVWATPRVQRNYMGIFEYAVNTSYNIRWRFYGNGNDRHQCAAQPGAATEEFFRNTLDEPAHFSATFSTSGNATTVRFMRRNAKTGAIEYEKTITTTTSIADFANPELYIGGTMWSDATPDADYDEVRIWSGVLGDDQLAANVLAGPDTPLGGGESGVVIPANTTFTVPTTGGYGYRTSNSVTIESGAKIRFDTTDYFGKGLRFKTGGFTVPSGSVTDYVELSDSTNYEATMEDANTILVQLKSALAYESTWIGGTPTAASDLANTANWSSTNAAGTAISAAPSAKTTVIIPAGKLGAFTVPSGASADWGRVLLGGHTATRYGFKDGSPDIFHNAWRDLALTGYTTVSAVPDGSNDISYFTGTTKSSSTPPGLYNAQMRLDGWFYVTAAQAGFWSMPNHYNDAVSFAIDGEWVLLNSTWIFTNGAGAYVSEGWHRFTFAAADAGGDWGSEYQFADGVYVPFVVSINGGTACQFSADNFTFGSDATTVTLSADADWSALGEIAVETGVTIDLNGHNLVIDDFTSRYLGVVITNSSETVSTLYFEDAPADSKAYSEGIIKETGTKIKLLQYGARVATWTGNGGDGSIANASNWSLTFKGEATSDTLPTTDYTVVISGSKVNMQVPSGTTLNCAGVEIQDCTFTADCDWTGLSVTPAISGTANLNGHNLTMPSTGLTATSGAAFSNSAATTNEVRFSANDSTVTATESTFIDGIANLTTAANAKIAIIHSGGDASGTLNVGAANNHTVFRAEAGTISMTANGQVGMVSGGTGYLDVAGGTVDFCTARDRGLQLGGANASSYVNISSGTLQANWIDAGHANVVECSIVQTGGEVNTGINNNGNLWLGRAAGGSATYSLSGGSINVTQGTLDVGNYGTGVFVQDGGTVTTGNGDIRLATFGGSNGKYTLNDGDISVMWWIHVGYEGIGAFTQNGGNVVLEGKNNNWLCFGNINTGNGTYTMNDGTLRIQNGIKTLAGTGYFELNGGTVATPKIWREGGTFSMNLNGGTIVATNVTDGANFISGLNALEFGSGGTTIDTAGYDVTVADCTLYAASGSALTKTGAGTLTLPSILSLDTVTVSNGTLALTAGCDNTASAASLTHRWSFASDYSDSVGTATGAAIGSAVAIEDGALVLSGSTHGTGALNLGKGLMPKGDATIEIWATRTGSQNYSRVFDIGTSSTDYFTMLWQIGWNTAQDRVEILKGNARKLQSDNTMVYDSNVKYHISVTFKANDNGSTDISWARRDVTTGEVVKSGSATVATWTLADIFAGSFYLGYSQYSDNDANAAYDEVRIWNGVLSTDALTLSAQKGPDASASDIAAIAAVDAESATRTLALADGATLNLGGNTLTQPIVNANGTLASGNLVVTERVNVTVGETMTVASGATLDLTGADIALVGGTLPNNGCTIATSASGGIVSAASRKLSGDLAGYSLILTSTKARIGKTGFTIIVR